MVRLGVAVRLLGRSAPMQPHSGHLSVGLIWLQEVLAYLAARRVSLYRLPTDLAACLVTLQPDMLERELDACQALLESIQQRIAQHQFRLTMHLMPGLGPAALSEAQAAQWAARVCIGARLLAALNSPHSVLVGHVGGVYGDRSAALERAAARVEQLPVWARRYLVLEPDEDGFTLADLLWLHARCGTPIVLDLLHQQIHNPQQIDRASALALAFASWQPSQRPKIHMSSQRTEAHLLPEGRRMRVVPPRIGQHADFINPFEFVEVLRAAQKRGSFDIMLEAKAADLALLRLREDTLRFAADLAPLIDGQAEAGGATDDQRCF